MKKFTTSYKGVMLSAVFGLSAFAGYSADIPLMGQGIETDPYLVSSADNWNQLSAFMSANNTTLEGAYVSLTADINFAGIDFSPLGAFAGCFNGQNHTVSGISYTTTGTYQGVFASIDASATVKNVTLKGTVNSDYAYTGGFTGKLSGHLENCVNQLDVTGSKGNVAGFAAKVYAGSVLSNCVNEGEITSPLSNIAGVVADGANGVTYDRCGNKGVVHSTGAANYVSGVVAVSLPSTFAGCYNTGEIIIDKPTSSTCVAGILSWANNVNNATPNLFTFTGCYNEAYINASSKVAGVLADVTIQQSNFVTIEMTGCYNTGSIIASGNPSGNVGTAGVSCFYTPGSKFVNCYNTGTVQAEKKPYCAGIVGHFKQIISNTPDPTLFDGCYNTGNIKVIAGQGSGILAYCHKNVTVKNCYNTGAVTGKSTLGGILSTMASGSEIHNCWNSGNITTDAETAAGIVANNANHCLISGCFNSGDITSNSSKTAGGIGASCGSDLIDCINFGRVKGLAEVGGLVGSPRQGNTTFTRCYNAGVVEAPDNACGGLIGVSAEATGYWNENNKVVDGYYVTGFNDFAIPQIGTAVSIADLTKLNMGDTWVSLAENCMPVQKHFAENASAIVSAAAVVPSFGDTFKEIASNFSLGTPAGVKWSASSSVVTIDGPVASVASVDNATDVVLTASNGNFKRVWNLTVVPQASTSIDGTLIDNGDEVVSRTYFNISGQAVSEPLSNDGRIYIVKETTAAGKISVRKVVNR